MILKFLLCLVWLAGVRPAIAQIYTARVIHFSELGGFTQQQLEAAAGINLGKSFNATDLGAAAQRLVDTGYFDDVAATVDGRITDATVKFTTKPTDHSHMLHVAFANFVWLTHEEVEAAIKTRFPLFNDYLPESSPHQDDIKVALTQALAAKSIVAEVGYETYEPTLRHPVREINFSVVSPSLRVANIKLGGVTPALVPLVQKSVNSTARTQYTEGSADVTTSDSILAPLLDAGYVEASLTHPLPVASLTASGEVAVVLSGTLHAGEIFHVSQISFAGTPIFSLERFASSTKLHAGDLASHAALLATLAPIDAAYRRLGYMDVVVRAIPTLDASTHTVAYVVQVEPGETYRVQTLTADNLTPAAHADFDRTFRMKAGELYNPEYAAGYLKSNKSLHALDNYFATFKAYADPNAHTVELVMTFALMKEQELSTPIRSSPAASK